MAGEGERRRHDTPLWRARKGDWPGRSGVTISALVIVCVEQKLNPGSSSPGARARFL